MSVSVSSENYLAREAMNLHIGGKYNLEKKELICLHLASLEKVVENLHSIIIGTQKTQNEIRMQQFEGLRLLVNRKQQTTSWM